MLDYDFRFGRGIRGEWGTIRLLLKWAEKLDFNEYIKIRNSFQLEDWENMIKFETSLCKKRPEYQPVGILEKDKNFAHLFQFDILKDVVDRYNDEIADKLVLSAAWIAKNIFKYEHKGDWLGVSTLWAIGESYLWPCGMDIAKPERFRKEYNIPKKSFYRQRKKFMDFICCKFPGQLQGGSIDMDPPTILDIF